MNLTYKNHFKFGYDHDWFRFRQSQDDQWMVSYGACEREPKDFHDECLATAALIRDLHDEPLTLLFSGGADSEIMLRSFYELGIPVKVAICQFANNLNIHDISYAIVCCQQLGVRFDLIKLDVLDFFRDGVFDYAEATYSNIPQTCTTMWLADQVDGIPVIGNGDCYVVKRVPEDYVDGISPYEPSPWDLYEREAIAAWYRHFMVHQRESVPGFFQYTPEIMVSFMKDERVIDLVNDRVIGKRSTLTSKFEIYKRYFPDLVPRVKYDGFENVRIETMELSATLRELWQSCSAIHATDYYDAIDMLSGQLDGPKGILYPHAIGRKNNSSINN